MAIGTVSFVADGIRKKFPNPLASPPGDVKVNGVSTAFTLGENNEIIFATAPAANATVLVIPSSTELTSQDAQSNRDPQGGWVPEHQWQLGTQLRFRQPTGYWGAWMDLRGPTPAYQWSGTSLRWANPDGSWGGFIDLMGPQPTAQWSGTSLRFSLPGGGNTGYVDLVGPQPTAQWSGTSLRFSLPGGGYTPYVDLKGAGVVTGGSAGQALAKVDGTDFNTYWATVSNTTPFGLRQAILRTPFDANGLSTFLPASSASLSLTTQNIAGAQPLFCSFANGFDSALGAADLFVTFSSNVTWTLPANAGQVWLTVDTAGNLDYLTLEPIY